MLRAQLERREREKEKRERGGVCISLYLTIVSLNLLGSQGEDGGWKLEERELEEKRRSLEGQKEAGQREMQKESPRNESFEKKEDGASPRSGEKPPQVFCFPSQ